MAVDESCAGQRKFDSVYVVAFVCSVGCLNHHEFESCGREIVRMLGGLSNDSWFQLCAREWAVLCVYSVSGRLLQSPLYMSGVRGRESDPLCVYAVCWVGCCDHCWTLSRVRGRERSSCVHM